jgi:hypothetical protein
MLQENSQNVAGDNLKVNELQTNFAVFAHPFARTLNGPILAMNGRYFHSRKALSGDVAHT